jgi:hypothetical protein
VGTLPWVTMGRPNERAGSMTTLRKGAPMTTPPRLDLNKLVAQIVLDVALIKWFADNGRRIAALSAIAVTGQQRAPTRCSTFSNVTAGGASHE